MFEYLQETLHNHSILMSQKFETQVCQWYEVMLVIYNFADKRISETRKPLYNVKWFSFFQKTDRQLDAFYFATKARNFY